MVVTDRAVMTARLLVNEGDHSEGAPQLSGRTRTVEAEKHLDEGEELYRMSERHGALAGAPGIEWRRRRQILEDWRLSRISTQ